MSQRNEPVPLPPIGPPTVFPTPRPFLVPEGGQWPLETEFPAEVPPDDLAQLADDVVRMVLG